MFWDILSSNCVLLEFFTSMSARMAVCVRSCVCDIVYNKFYNSIKLPTVSYKLLRYYFVNRKKMCPLYLRHSVHISAVCEFFTPNLFFISKSDGLPFKEFYFILLLKIRISKVFNTCILLRWQAFYSLIARENWIRRKSLNKSKNIRARVSWRRELSESSDFHVVHINWPKRNVS